MLQRVLEPEVMDSVEESEAYAAMDHSGPNQAFVERLLSLGASGRMLDLGTGPGDIPVLVCEWLPAAHVVAVDLAESMLSLARERVRARGLESRIELQLADAKRLPWRDGAFDAVFSNTILHHIPDPAPFLAEAARVLRPGGALLVRDLLRPASVDALDELVERHAADDTPVQRALFRASLHAALTPDELRSLAARLGLDAEVVIDSDRHVSLQRAARS
ncbi:MAG: class I SAM-dependent methyltransferase [Myxococcota bacterium]|nr:class I SAM-dependent methyltransferase [Myxococcota bacterium]